MSEHWFGNRTSKWKVVPLREVARLGTGHTPSRSVDEYWVNCTIPWVTVTDIRDHGEWSLAPLQSTKQHISELGLANSAAILHPAGTVMLSRTASIGFSCITGKEMATTQAFVTWTPNESMLNGKYLHAALKAMSQQYDYLAYGATHLTIYFPDIKTLRIPLPPLEDQDLIAAFLDRETAKIDELVVEQRRLMDLLKEKRQAVISHAVTRGLNPDAPLKHSGIEWLGEVPEHWETRTIAKASTKITNGYVGPTRDILVEAGVPYIQATHIKGGGIRFDEGYFVTREWSVVHAKSILAEGHVLIVQTGAGTGDVGLVSKEEVGFNCHALIIVAPDESVLRGAFLSAVLQSSYGRQKLESIQTGAMHPHLNCGEVKFVEIPLPPLAEQMEIVEYIHEAADRFDTLTAEAQRAIDLLQERRTALISAAVTGQIDVRQFAGEVAA